MIALAYVVCALVWGTTWYAIRACIGGPDGYPTFEAAALRFAIASALLVAIVALARLRPLPRGAAQWGWLVAAGLLDAAGYALVYLGEERIPGGLAAVLFAVHPLILAVLLAVTGLERVRPAEVAGAVVALVGVALLFADRADVSGEQAVGVALVLGSVVCSTLYTMIMKRHATGVHPLAATAVFLTVTALALGAVVLARGPAPVAWPPPVEPTVALLYLALIGTVVAFGTYFWLLERISLMAIATLVFVIPLISLAVDAVWEREIRLGARAYAGVAVVLAGLGVSLLVGRAVRPRRAPARRSAGS